jgi:hypothetical protein
VTDLPASDSSDSSDFAFIGAVHGLLNSSRSAEKTDLLLAAVLQSLYEFDRGLPALVERVQQIWPGAVSSDNEVMAAIEVGIKLGLIAEVESLDPDTTWTLTRQGMDDVRQHVDWVKEIRHRARDQVQERARSGLQTELTAEQAEQVLDRLVHGLARAIRATQEPYVGQVDALLHTGKGGQRLAPRSFDRAALLESLNGSSDDLGQFVRTLAFDAIDPLDPFANELVSHITTGCVMHAFVAGTGRHELLKRLGKPEGQRAVLDTPVLIDLLGPKRLAIGLQRAIRSAVDSGWDVVAFEHSIEEAREVLQRDVPGIQVAMRTALADGVQATWYATLADGQLPSLCVEVLRDGTYQSLDHLLAAADRLPRLLEGFGVNVRGHGNDGDSRVQASFEALEEQLGVTNSTRSEHVLERDANTMAAVWRRRARPSRGGRWPGGWVITRDRAMTPAYLHAQTRDKVPLTLTGGQWATLLSISAPPIEIEGLARVAAEQFVDEAAWVLPVRYPANIALDLARQLSPQHGGSNTDLRMAQMTLDEALEAPDSSQIAAAVLSARTRRVNNLAQAEKERWLEGVSREKERATGAQLQALEEANARLAAEQDAERLSTQNAQLTDALSWREEQMKRITVSAVVTVLCLGWLAGALVTGSTGSRVVASVGLLVVSYAMYRWCTDRDARVWPIVIGVLVDGVGLVSGLLQLLEI